MSITMKEAQARLPEIISTLVPGEHVEILRDGQPVATLVRDAAAPQGPWPCKAGSARDKILWISPDFDAPLNFRE